CAKPQLQRSSWSPLRSRFSSSPQRSRASCGNRRSRLRRDSPPPRSPSHRSSATYGTCTGSRRAGPRSTSDGSSQKRGLTDCEVAIQYRRGDARGIEIERLRPERGDARQRGLALRREILKCEAAIEPLARDRRVAFVQLSQKAIAHRHQHHDVTAREHRQIFLELARGAALHKIRNHDHQSAPLLMTRQRLDQHPIVRLERKGAECERRAHDCTDAAETRPGTCENAQLAIERDEAYAIAVLFRRARQRNRTIDRVIELG